MDQIRDDLTVQAYLWHRNATVKGREAFGYKVHGLPTNRRAFVANFGAPRHEEWQLLQVRDGVYEDWDGHYTSLLEALTVLRSSTTTD